MSFVDLATLAMHRRQEMEARIQVFLEKCDHAIHNLHKLKVQSQGFVEQLNCDPSELKERFLNCMQQLDEYTYLITDFNLAVTKLDENSSTDLTPVLETNKTAVPSPKPFNLIDTLYEPTPSTSAMCANQCPVKNPKKKKKQKQEKLLISFSSMSGSSDSVAVSSGTVEKEVQCKLNEGLNHLEINDSKTTPIEGNNLPAQTLLQLDEIYAASIVHVDGLDLWVITDNVDDVYNLITDMTKYYKENVVELSADQVKSLVYCAAYDEKTETFYRGLFIRLIEDNTSTAEVYLVDTGETRMFPTNSLQPLVSVFCDKPPMARCCHLAGVDHLDSYDQELLSRQAVFMEEFVGQTCSIVVDDNTSESIGVYVVLPTKSTLNDLVIQNGFAVKTDNSIAKAPTPTKVPEEIEEIDISQCPEYEDPVEAVTGYHNRDEADICPHYKGGSKKACFKGARCKKRHVMKHPDGWTLDRVCVAGKVRSVSLPAPGTWLRARVTCVLHHDRLYVHLPDDVREPIPSFGVVLPPTTLAGLVRDMNSPATKLAYKKLKLTPAPGELVAALYPFDDQWYRARVISSTRADQSVEVMYIDYGTELSVKEDAVRVLEARFLSLPAQAVRAVLPGLRVRDPSAPRLAAARRALSALALDRDLHVHVLARDYDEIIVELYDQAGNNIVETLAAQKVVEICEYQLPDNTQSHQLVLP